MSDDPTGPSRETLLNLLASMPSFKKAIRKQMLTGRGKPAPVKRATQFCTICGCLHGEKMLQRDAEIELAKVYCPRCRGLLDEGYTALTCSGEFAFAKFEHMSNYAGTVLHVGPNDMAEIKRRFGAKNDQAEPRRAETDAASGKDER